VWANPLPVTLVLVPVTTGGREGLLVIRRAIPPAVGRLALIGGFVEDDEAWEVGGAREANEEAGIVLDPKAITPFWFSSTVPKPNRVLLFGLSPVRDLASVEPFAPNHEVSERGIIFGPNGLEDVFAFSLHIDAVRRYFAQRGITGDHGFTAG
jgi:8-oxo-dGTP pyrophosphatase MutT (NUDIX family)